MFYTATVINSKAPRIIRYTLLSLLTLGILLWSLPQWSLTNVSQRFHEQVCPSQTFTISSVGNGQTLHDHGSKPLLHSVRFEEHAAYQNLSRTYDTLWNELVPENGGFYPEQDSNGKVVAKGLSMFHQLHCLAMIRISLQRAMGFINNTDVMSASHAHHHDHPDSSIEEETEHVLHCFDYIRQVMLCMADETVEDVSEEAKDGRPIVTGMVERKCKDPLPLYEKASMSPRDLKRPV
ncbi:hypothetical protein F5Y19DRAFT_216915 [Xylariaceae sp. FL1651]|nr:hypothetical protein F5Y19DRAFT_216915 [Xylariaceae sp. FL1651]